MDNNILSVLTAVFKFIEANKINTVDDLKGKVLSSAPTHEWDYCISAESLGRYLKANNIETQLEWDNHADEVSKTLMYDDIDDFSDVRSKLDERQEYKELLDNIYHAADELTSAAESIRAEADI
jgi:uncharacterized protein (UPF0297 family)